MNSPMQLKVVVGWALLVLIGVASLSWLQPRLLGQAQREHAQLQQRLARAEDGAAEIRALVDQLSMLKDSTKSIKHVPTDSQFAGLIQDLGTQLEALGIVDREITNGGSVDLGPAKSIPMRIRMTSGFTGVYKTIEWIEALPRLIRVQRVLIEATDLKDPWDSQVDVEITLDAVFDPSAKPAALAGVDPGAS